MKNNDKKMLFGIGIVFLFLATVGFSYAYFSNAIANKEVKDQVVETGTLSLRYVDGPEINMQNIKPGSTITKTVYVANTGTLDAKYNLVWQELVNEIANDEMVIEASCTRMNGQTEEVDGTCEGLTETPIKRIKIKENVSIEPSIVHKYDITITFKEMNKDQNYNQGKTFNGVLGVKEYKTPEVINCTYDGELTQGAEFVNGQYTYRYMQEGTVVNGDIVGYYLNWNNISIDGWGVARTDVNSNDALTDKICTYINDKPVVSMLSLFAYTWADSIDLDSLNTSNVMNMSGMFAYSGLKTLDLSNFDTRNVTNMSSMFSSSRATVLDLSGFDTRNVTDMRDMFSGSKATTFDLSNFDTSKITDMNGMFASSHATTLNLSNFDTRNVTDMSYMFASNHATNLDLSSFDTSNVTNMNNMFSYSAATTLDLSNFDTSKVTNMSYMFKGNQATTLDLSSFDTSNVTNMSYMFSDSTATYINLSSFDTSNVTNMSWMFSESQATILDLSNFNTSNVTNIFQMFQDSQATTIDLSSFDTSNITDMRWLFENATNLNTIYASSKYNTSNVTYSSNMFNGCTSLVGGSGTTYDSTKIDKTYARIDGGTSSPGYFTLKSN